VLKLVTKATRDLIKRMKRLNKNSCFEKIDLKKLQKSFDFYATKKFDFIGLKSRRK
jgi:hypothetical protein